MTNDFPNLWRSGLWFEHSIQHDFKKFHTIFKNKPQVVRLFLYNHYLSYLDIFLISRDHNFLQYLFTCVFFFFFFFGTNFLTQKVHSAQKWTFFPFVVTRERRDDCSSKADVFIFTSNTCNPKQKNLTLFFQLNRKSPLVQ